MVTSVHHVLGLIAAFAPLFLVDAASPPTSATASSTDTQTGTPQPSLIATAKLAGTFNVTGQVDFALQSGSGPVAVSVEIDGLHALSPSAMYSYHVHTNPIAGDGNCASALGHLDPLAVTDAITCSPQMGQYCQIGDLSGRNGKLSGLEPTAKVSYVDNYLRFWPQPFSLLGRSVVVHLPNSTRIACGNITSVVDGTANPDGTPTSRASNYTTQYPSKAPPAPLTKYQPFEGTTPNNIVISQITLPSPLPTVQDSPNIILGTAASSRAGNSSTLPAALNATSPFSYTPGAPLPTQSDASVAATTATTQPSSSQKAASNGAGTLAPPFLSAALAGMWWLACF